MSIYEAVNREVRYLRRQIAYFQFILAALFGIDAFGLAFDDRPVLAIINAGLCVAWIALATDWLRRGDRPFLPDVTS